MNVFILSTGRCGTETFACACHHITNYTVAHESQAPWRNASTHHPYFPLTYPCDHIEVDNRLSWFLGTLDKHFGDQAFYVHLLRNREDVAKSISVRGDESILFAFAWGVLQHYGNVWSLSDEQRYEIGLQYWDTVNHNIEMFLESKPLAMTMWLHDIKEPFARFWDAVGAEGSLDAALEEWDVRHNATRPSGKPQSPQEREQWHRNVASMACTVTKFVAEGNKFILVDHNKINSALTITGRQPIPFLEQNGQYWGPPPDDETAIMELERLRSDGAQFMIIAWPAFWWLDYYSGFHRHLRSHFQCVSENEQAVVFDLRV